MIERTMPDPGAGQSALPDYETKAELARRLGVSGRTIDNLMVRCLPYVAITRKRAASRASLWTNGFSA